MRGVLKTVASLRRGGLQVPIVFYVYYNVLHHYGLKKFVRDAATAGVDGALALDLPPEEAGAFEKLMKRAGLHPIYLVAPTTPAKRIHKIARHASGFIYYVSREGVNRHAEVDGSGGDGARRHHSQTLEIAGGDWFWNLESITSARGGTGGGCGGGRQRDCEPDCEIR